MVQCKPWCYPPTPVSALWPNWWCPKRLVEAYWKIQVLHLVSSVPAFESQLLWSRKPLFCCRFVCVRYASTPAMNHSRSLSRASSGDMFSSICFWFRCLTMLKPFPTWYSSGLFTICTTLPSSPGPTKSGLVSTPIHKREHNVINTHNGKRTET